MLYLTKNADVIAYFTAMNVCGDAGQWQQSLRLLTAARKSSVRLDTAAFNSLIIACETASEWLKALELLHSKEAVPLAAVMRSCHKASAWHMALQLFEPKKLSDLRLGERSESFIAF